MDGLAGHRGIAHPCLRGHGSPVIRFSPMPPPSRTVAASGGDLLRLYAGRERKSEVSDTLRMARCWLARVVTLLLICTPAHAEGEYSAFRAFGIDEIRLGGMHHNLDVRNDNGGVG